MILICFDSKLLKFFLWKYGEWRGSNTCTCIFTLIFKWGYPLCKGKIFIPLFCWSNWREALLTCSSLYLSPNVFIRSATWASCSLLVFSSSSFSWVIYCFLLSNSLFKVLTTWRLASMNAPKAAVVSIASTCGSLDCWVQSICSETDTSIPVWSIPLFFPFLITDLSGLL